MSAAALCFTVPALAKEVDLAQALGYELISDALTAPQIKQVKSFTDGDIKLAPHAISETVEYVIALPQIASANRLEIHLRPNKKRGAGVRVELLGSIASADTGFQLLREGVANTNQARTRLKFLPSAVRWLMVRVTPSKKASKVAVAEIQVFGTEGPPDSEYAFQENPADTQRVLKGLSDVLSVRVSPAEQQLFADAADGTLDQWSLEQAAILASGVTENSQQVVLLKQLDKLLARARKSVSKTSDPFKKAQRLLKFLHKQSLHAGYVEKQTDVSTLLTQGTYNCVSSAVLFTLIGRRIGLDIRGIEVPDHAFAIVYDGSRYADVETTTRAGFNPARNRAAIKAFAQKTGFAYIPGSNASKRRETTALGLIALIYYNHGVTHSRAGNHEQALLSYYRALQLDAELASAIKNALASLGRWANAESESGNYQRALDLIQTGLSLAPTNRVLRHNRRVVWQNRIRDAQEAGDLALVVSLTDAAHVIDPKAGFDKQQANGFIIKARALTEKNDWPSAVAVLEQGRNKVNAASKKSLNRFATNVLLRWMSEAIKARDWQEAYRAGEAGMRAMPKERRLQNNAAYLLQEASADEFATNGRQAGIKAAQTVLELFPRNRRVQQAARTFVRKRMFEHQQAGNLQQAIRSIDDYAVLLPSDQERSKLIGSLVLGAASTHLKAKDWARAADVYEQARIALPDQKIRSYRQNVSFLVQEWLKKSGKLEPGLASELLGRFGDVRGLSKVVVGHYHRFAKKAIDEKAWQRAIDIYEQGLVAVPTSSLFKKNIKYCRQEMNKG